MARQTATVLMLWAISSCVPPKQVPAGVVVPPTGQRLEAVQGPMPGFGPFNTYSDTLLAACPLILALPNAVAGRETDQDFRLRWELSQEYCAWVYYTPDGKYEMSMLAASSVQDHPGRRQCALPDNVRDTRYSPNKLGYVFVLHNHPYPRTLSRNDIGFIVEQGRIHGLNARTHQGEVPLSIVAFYSNSLDVRCDGFFQYAPLSGEILRWSREGRAWRREVTGVVKWTSPTNFSVEPQ